MGPVPVTKSIDTFLPCENAEGGWCNAARLGPENAQGNAYTDITVWRGDVVDYLYLLLVSWYTAVRTDFIQLVLPTHFVVTTMYVVRIRTECLSFTHKRDPAGGRMLTLSCT